MKKFNVKKGRRKGKKNLIINNRCQVKQSTNKDFTKKKIKVKKELRQ